MNPPPAPPAKVSDRLLFWSAALFIGLLQTWAHRHDFAPDSISYIELGWAAARSGLAHLVSGYWSPLYPFLLSLEFRFFSPSPQFEFTVVHLLNFVLFFLTIAGFELFLRELIIARRGASPLTAESVDASERVVWLWGGVLFVWAAQFWLGPSLMTPDLCVAMLTFLASALLLRIRRGLASWRVFLVLGALLGLSYLAKTAMFFIAPVFLFSAYVLGKRSGISLRAAALRILLATIIFACFALPFIHALSVQKGRLTIGDAGRINFAEYVNRATLWVHWQGEPSGTGTPAHPTRKVFSDPAIFEFATPVPGTYPPWYDPSYWYEGIRPSFALKNQLWAMFRTANTYLRFFSKSGALWLVFAAVWFSWKKAFRWDRLAPGTWLVFLPSAATLAMYELVHVEFRFVAPFTLILLLGVLAKVWFKKPASPWNVRRLALIIVLAPALAVVWSAARDVTLLVRNAPDEQWEVARQLHNFGISPGTRIATFGIGSGAAWAHLAGARIIAEIPDKELPRFIAADAGRKRQIFELLSSLGAATVVTWNPAVANSSEGWRVIPGTHYFVWLPAARSEAGSLSRRSIP
jgi:hypothetical protein